MITAYHRPKTLEEAMQLLSSKNIRPLGGGTILSQSSDETFEVMDLQALGLDRIHKSDNYLDVGATVSLQGLLESPLLQEGMKSVVKREVSINLRNMRTVAGTLMTCDGRSPFAAMMLALDAKITLLYKPVVGKSANTSNLSSIVDFFSFRNEQMSGKLISKFEIPFQPKITFESIARSPKDKPIIFSILAVWPSGRLRLVIGGWGKFPTLAMDGDDSSSISSYARNATLDASDEWASSDYRVAMSEVLSKRCLEEILVGKKD